MSNLLSLRRRPKPEQLALLPFRGFGTPSGFHVAGRVLDRRGVVEPRPDDSVFRTLKHMRRRYLARPGGGARVRVRVPGVGECFGQTDDDGHFRVAFEPDAPARPADGRLHAEIQLETTGETAEASVFVPAPTATLGVISDIDDTVLRTEATDKLQMARIVLLNSAETRLPFSGVAAFYRALRDGPDGAQHNPVFYVSSSGWQVYDVMRDFMREQDLPAGPILLREMELSREGLFGSKRHDHKLDRVEDIFASAPHLPFLLIGDSGQRDAELYCEVVRRHPGRVPAIYLRDVMPTPRRRGTIEDIARSVADHGSELVLVDDTLEAAQHACERGWLDPERLPAIARDTEADEPDSLVPSLLVEAGRWIARKTRPRRWVRAVRRS